MPPQHEALLFHNADPNLPAATKNKHTPLHDAILAAGFVNKRKSEHEGFFEYIPGTGKQTDVVSTLLSSTKMVTNVHAANKSGKTALVLATEWLPNLWDEQLNLHPDVEKGDLDDLLVLPKVLMNAGAVVPEKLRAMCNRVYCGLMASLNLHFKQRFCSATAPAFVNNPWRQLEILMSCWFGRCCFADRSL